MKKKILSILTVLVSVSYADTVKFSVRVVEDLTQHPIANVKVGAGFTMDAGLVWNNRYKYEHKNFITDINGCCEVSGESNCGHAGCYVAIPPEGYYKPCLGIPLRYKRKNLFGVWQPDDLVVTLRLQRVEYPIPLFVKNLFKNGSDSVRQDYFGKGRGEMKLDLLKGDWLPPLGNGEFSDVVFTRLKREDLGMGTTFRGGITAPAYRDSLTVRFAGQDNGLVEIPSDKSAGIKIRTAPEKGYVSDYRVSTGYDLNVKRFWSSKPDRNFAFRIRTKKDQDGRIVSAYYGKIYGDIEIKKKSSSQDIPVAAPALLYYLNPTPLDRNLEWDMKTNLCPDPNLLSQKQP